MEWFIQLHRKILEWEWYDDMNTKVLFLHLLLVCNYKENKWRWITIQKWQKITSLDHLAKECWLTVRQTRTSLEKLESTWEVTKQTTSSYTILTLVNWASYNIPNDKPPTNERQTSDKRATTNNKDNNNNKENNTDTVVATQPNEFQESMKYLKMVREKESRNELIEYRESWWFDFLIPTPEYSKNHKDEWLKFLLYWSECSKTWKLKAELEKTFEIKKRFATWMSRKKENAVTLPKQAPNFGGLYRKPWFDD